MSKSPHGFIKTASRGSAYYTKGGGYWIVKVQSQWHLIRMGVPAEGLERQTLGVFKTLTEAGNFYKENK